MSGELAYPADVLAEAAAHALPAYPSEACGVVLRGRDGALRFRPMQNVADRYHEKDPETFPRTSRQAYLFHPKEQLEVWEASERGDDVVVAIVHSHCDVGAYFSKKDQEDALGGTADTPLFPGVEYVVVSIRGTTCDDIRAYRWERGGWIERRLPVPRIP